MFLQTSFVGSMLIFIFHTAHSFLQAYAKHDHYLRHQSLTVHNRYSNLHKHVARSFQSESCKKPNGTEIQGLNDTVWTVLCNADFLAQDIFPFILSGSFEDCQRQCEQHNAKTAFPKCEAFVFAPGRTEFADDCYLKSSTKDMIQPAPIDLISAVLTLQRSNYTSPPPSDPSNSTTSTDEYRQPRVVNTVVLGNSTNKPTTQYVNHTMSKPAKLAANVIKPGIDTSLITDYPLAGDTGTWTTSSMLLNLSLADMKIDPRLSRDGGKGAKVNNKNIFMFCDTATYGQIKDPVYGYFNGFVSSSVAVDEDMSGLQDSPLVLVDTIGQWQDDVGRMRGLSPMTTGEQAFNIAISGQGYRYAVWPQSSPITLNQTHAVVYAVLVYLEVDMETQARPNYTSLGNTLLLISIDPIYGPHADRLQNQFFKQDEIAWGSLGGIRAWSSDKTSGDQGALYLFGEVEQGIMVARVAMPDFDDRSNYEYWNGQVWTYEMPPQDSTVDALMLDQPVMDLDIFFSPYHKTFIMIYLTPDADNTFYYRYLTNEDGSNLDIIPSHEENGDLNYVEQILKKKWSTQKLLYTAPKPDRGYIYAGGVHAGYFDSDDITEGGIKMLLTWTEHTYIDPNKPDSGYAHKALVVELGG